MTDKQIIRAEIERRIKDSKDGYGGNLKSMLSFIDSLPEKTASEELEKEIEYIIDCEKKYMRFAFKHQLIAYVARYFANWQKKKMIKHI